MKDIMSMTCKGYKQQSALLPSCAKNSRVDSKDLLQFM